MPDERAIEPATTGGAAESPVERRYDRLPEPGEAVFTSDGKPFGAVKQTHGGYVEIAREGDSEYWLSDAYIASNDGDRVYLTVPGDEADIHRLRQPGLEAVGHRQTGLGTSLDTDKDALHVREMMEREMLAQRGTMDTGLRNER